MQQKRKKRQPCKKENSHIDCGLLHQSFSQKLHFLAQIFSLSPFFVIFSGLSASFKLASVIYRKNQKYLRPYQPSYDLGPKNYNLQTEEDAKNSQVRPLSGQWDILKIVTLCCFLAYWSNLGLLRHKVNLGSFNRGAH